MDRIPDFITYEEGQAVPKFRDQKYDRMSDMNIKVAVIIPSRGLMFSKTAEEIVRNTQGLPHQKFFSHKLPIPDCFEWPTIKALKDPDITHFWYRRRRYDSARRYFAQYAQ
jgi:hypothetical protein